MRCADRCKEKEDVAKLQGDEMECLFVGPRNVIL
jgi:hypothetical protein